MRTLMNDLAAWARAPVVAPLLGHGLALPRWLAAALVLATLVVLGDPVIVVVSLLAGCLFGAAQR